MSSWGEDSWEDIPNADSDHGTEPPEDMPARLLEYIPGFPVWNDSGCAYVQVTAYDLNTNFKHLSFGGHADAALDSLAATFNLPGSLGGTSVADCLFLDCETTGLGRSSLPFLIGVGTFEILADIDSSMLKRNADGSLVLGESTVNPGPTDTGGAPTHFVIRQLFAWHPREECAVLQVLQDLAASRPVWATFNGDAFDIPLLRARYHTNLIYFPELPLNDPFTDHAASRLDLLPLARKLWRRRIGSCSLSNCEHAVLGLARAQQDVPGSLIPGMYRQYIETGRVHDMVRVFYHNRQDIVTMPFLLERMVQTVGATDAKPDADLAGEDALSLAVVAFNNGNPERASALLHAAIRTLHSQPTQADAFRLLALHYKRQGDWDRAVRLWERWISTATVDTVHPYIELAKYHEWQSKDLDQADTYTRWAMYVRESSPFRHPPQTAAELQHRLTRISRKKRRLVRS